MDNEPVRTRGAQPNRRVELLDAARRVIERRGFAKATVGEITDEAGVSLGLLHYYFDSRDDVAAAALGELVAEEIAVLRDLARRQVDPPERLAAFVELTWNTPAWPMWINACGAAVHSPRLLAALDVFEHDYRAVLADLLAEGARQNCWRCLDPDDMAGRLIAMFDGVGLHMTLHPSLVSKEVAAAWLRQLIERELNVVLPDPPPPVPTRATPSPYEAPITIRARDLDTSGRVHPAVLLTYLGEARESWLEARLGALGPPPRLDVTRVTADFHYAPARRGAVVTVRCTLDGIGRTTVRTRETIIDDAGEVVVHAGATVLLVGEDGQPRPLAAADRNALLS